MSKWSIQHFDDDAEMMNLTPLLDVLFVVLILFMLAAPLMQIDQIKLSEASSIQEEYLDHGAKALNILLKADNTILIQGHKIPLPLLTKTFKTLKQQKPDLIPILYPDKNAKFGAYQIIKNALEEAEFHDMEVVLKSH